MRYCFLLLLCALVLSCSRTSSIDGRLVDGKGYPLSGVRVIAQKVKPAKGYDQVETTTDSNGQFRVKGLFPAAAYTLFPLSAKWKTSAKVTAESPPKGQARPLPSALTVRFTYSGTGVITDSRTGLQWAPAPDATMSWVEAAAYAAGLSLEGGGWRLPARSEVRELWDGSTEGHADPAFRLKRNWVWTSESKDSTDAWFFSFENRYEDGHCKEWLLTRGRVLAVRPIAITH